MDIFVRHVPEQATDKSLKKFFRTKFQPFKIDDFSCHKLKRRGCAILTILDVQKAQIFLNLYGESDQKGTGCSRKEPLLFMGKPIHCSQSKNEPDKYLLRTLQKDAEDRKKQPRSKTSAIAPTNGAQRQFGYTSIQCGHWDYRRQSLVYISHFSDYKPGSIIFGKKNLALVAEPDGTRMSTYRLDIAYFTVQSITTGSFQDPSVTITMSEAPSIYQQYAAPSMPLEHLFQRLNFGQNSQTTPKRRRVASLGGLHETIRSTCLVYRILISKPSDIRNISRLLEKGTQMPPSIPWPTRVYAPQTAYGGVMDQLTSALSSRYDFFDFDLKFQLQRLAQNGYLTPGRVLELLPHVSQIFQRLGDSTAQAVRKLFINIPFAGPEVDGEVFATINLKQFLNRNEEACRRELSHKANVAKCHQHICLVHKATITPAGIYLEGPTSETKNRVLREYSDHIEYFIRVTFSDEDGERMRFDRFVSLEEIFHTRFKNVLDGVISVAGRDFEFLGFSHSSLREQTCWFMAPFKHNGALIDAAKVIARLGDFSLFRSPAKCAARIGQAFSNTTGAVKVSPTAFQLIPDVTRNERVFSDGVGTISRKILEKIWKDYPLTKNPKPFLYQIRYAGAKGMISFDSRLKGEALQLRPSMIKFHGSKASDIEICGSASRPLPMYLNRQYIKIMEDLGVECCVFEDLQKDAVDRLRHVTTSAANAASFLERELIAKVARAPWLIRKLYSMGLDFLEDSFLRGIVELGVLLNLRELKQRSRILVPQGVTLYGIMDETNTLAEGEIYCCTDKTVITGKVTITRAPALHPGDVRVADAVDVPDDSPLNALHNCIVFSQQGSRDLPSQLSGGDLDGDLYSVIYDSRLLPQRLVEPADYPRVLQKDIGRPVTRKDMTDFFIEFMENDQLGRIALNHQQLADHHDEGTLHRECVTLAEMHSTAVDFSKTGIPVDMTKFPKSSLWRPDFMAPNPRVAIAQNICSLEEQIPQYLAEQEEDPVSDLDPDATSYRYYESKKVLGVLYRAIDEKNFLAELQKRVRQLERPASFKQSVLYQLWTYVQKQTTLVQWDHYRDWARETKEVYEAQVLYTIDQYSTHPRHPISELEVFVGNLLGKNEGARNKRLRELSTNMKEEFERDVAFTIDCIVKGPEEGQEDEEALARSIACFAVAIEEAQRPLERGVRRLESFTYVAAAVCLSEVENFQGSSGLPLEYFPANRANRTRPYV